MRVFLLPIVGLLFAAGCGDNITYEEVEGEQPYVPEPFTPTAATQAYCGDDYIAVEERITGLLSMLTLEEKVSMLHGGADGLMPIDNRWHVEGVDSLGIPGLHMIDGPRGVSAMTGVTATAFPVAMARGASWDTELEERIGAAIGRELRATGGDVLLAPTINILRHPAWGRSQETYGEDTHHLGSMAVAFVRGVQSQDVVASVKHFAANSIEETRFQVDVQIDERTLREIYLPHFRRVVQDAQVGSLMTAYNSVNGFYCDLNSHLLTDILKGEWEFQGFVESDWVVGTHDDVESIRAGLDIEMPSANHFASLVEQTRNGEIAETEIDASVRRVLRAQFCFGLDENPAVRDANQRETDEHLKLALESAQRSIVLLRNEGALPLDREVISNVVLTGPIADVENIGDLGSSNVMTSDVVTALEGIRDRAGDVEITHIDSETLTDDDRTAIEAADAVVIVAGYTFEDEGEGQIAAGDRDSLSLSPEQEAFIKDAAAIGTPTIVVLEAGSSLVISNWVDDVAAIVMAWYPGGEGGYAIADVLFGDVNPAGRLPISFPSSEEDLPEFDNVSTTVTYGYYHGYRHLDNEGNAPLFAFGHGLSYTSFDYANLTLEKSELGPDETLRIEVDVTNSGDMAGIETVQLYVGAVGSRVERAVKDLRGFARVELAPGETKTVTLEIPAASLAFYDVEALDWEVEAIEYVAYVGPSSGDLPLNESFTVSK